MTSVADKTSYPGRRESEDGANGNVAGVNAAATSKATAIADIVETYNFLPLLVDVYNHITDEGASGMQARHGDISAAAVALREKLDNSQKVLNTLPGIQRSLDQQHLLMSRCKSTLKKKRELAQLYRSQLFSGTDASLRAESVCPKALRLNVQQISQSEGSDGNRTPETAIDDSTATEPQAQRPLFPEDPPNGLPESELMLSHDSIGSDRFSLEDVGMNATPSLPKQDLMDMNPPIEDNAGNLMAELGQQLDGFHDRLSLGTMNMDSGLVEMDSLLAGNGDLTIMNMPSL